MTPDRFYVEDLMQMLVAEPYSKILPLEISIAARGLFFSKVNDIEERR